MKSLNIIANVSEDGGLGQAGELLWHIPADLQFFKQTTMGAAVVMGRKTFASIGRPLPGRRNIVLSSHGQDVSGVEWCHNPAELEQLLSQIPEAVFIIGGASLYQMFIDRADCLYLTEVHRAKPADTFFPQFNHADFSRQVIKNGTFEGTDFTIVKYSRL